MDNSKLLFDFYPISFFDEHPIKFKKSLKPLVSIIIPVYNQLQYTLNCLNSLQKTSGGIAIEVIVVNDNSTDETLQYISNIEGVITINNLENLGFLKNVNKGINKAVGDFVLLLNNDVVVLSDFLKELLNVFNNQHKVGAVGAMAIHPSGFLLEAGSLLFNDGTATNIGRESLPNNPKYNFLKTVDYCSGYCLLFKRFLPNGNLVQLDEHFLPAYYEETDLCMQLQYNFGLNIYYQPFAKLIHFESISYGKEKDSKKQRLIETNNEKFSKKWSHVLSNLKFANSPKKRKVTKDIYLNKLYEGKRILFFEDPLNDVMLNSVVKLNSEGHKVYVLLDDNRDKEQIESLQRQGVEVLYPYLNQKNKKVSKLKIIWQLASVIEKFETNNSLYRIVFAFFKLFYK